MNLVKALAKRVTCSLSANASPIPFEPIRGSLTDTRPSQLVRSALAIASVAVVAITGLAANAAAAGLTPLGLPAVGPFAVSRAVTADSFSSSSGLISRDSAREALDDTAIDALVTQRMRLLAAEGVELEASLQNAAVEARLALLNDEFGAISEEALRLTNLNNFFFPAQGPIISGYGMRLHPILGVWRLHDGVDIGAACRQPVYAAQSGYVTRVEYGYSGGSGNNVLIDHGMIDGARIMSRYLHLTSFSVKPGDFVQRGQQIGLVGSTGLSVSCHLHFIVYRDGQTINPVPFLNN